MDNTNLKRLLAEYSSKRSKEIAEADTRKKEIYNKFPRLQEIDDELSSYAIHTAKSILQTNDKSLLNDLNLKKKNLLAEKDEIYKSIKIASSILKPKLECILRKELGMLW